MVFKVYVKRKGKTFGPYYYKTVRLPNGKVRKIYLGTNLEDIKEKPVGQPATSKNKFPRPKINLRGIKVSKLKSMNLLIILFAIMALSILSPQYTGFIIKTEGIFGENLNLFLTESQNIPLNIQNPISQFSVKGELNGSGLARLYIQDSTDARELLFEYPSPGQSISEHISIPISTSNSIYPEGFKPPYSLYYEAFEFDFQLDSIGYTAQITTDESGEVVTEPSLPVLEEAPVVQQPIIEEPVSEESVPQTQEEPIQQEPAKASIVETSEETDIGVINYCYGQVSNNTVCNEGIFINNQTNAVLDFNLDSIPDYSTINEIKLNIYVENVSLLGTDNISEQISNDTVNESINITDSNQTINTTDQIINQTVNETLSGNESNSTIEQINESSNTTINTSTENTTTNQTTNESANITESNQINNETATELNCSLRITSANESTSYSSGKLYESINSSERIYTLSINTSSIGSYSIVLNSEASNDMQNALQSNSFSVGISGDAECQTIIDSQNTPELHVKYTISQQTPVLMSGNTAPSLTNTSTNATSVKYGDIIKFTALFSEPDGDSVKLLIANNSVFTNCNYTIQTGCIASGSATASSPATAELITSTNITWYAQVCDSNNNCDKLPRVYELSSAIAPDTVISGTATLGKLGTVVKGKETGYDLVASAPYAFSNLGAVYVFYEVRNLRGTMNTTSANVTIRGNYTDKLGTSLEIESFLNAPAQSALDLIIGAQYANTNRGRAYVIPYYEFEGTYTTSANINIDEGSSRLDLVFFGNGSADVGSGSDNIAYSIAIGDVNNDSYEDIIMGGRSADGSGDTVLNAGEVYVFYGNFSGCYSSYCTHDLAYTAANVTIYGENVNDYIGEVVAAGDINNDSIDDIIIGGANTQIFVIYGSDSLASEINLAEESPDINITRSVGGPPALSMGYEISNTLYGDINNDSVADLVIGDGGANGNAGEAYVIYGSSNMPSAINLATEANVTMTGGGRTGFSVHVTRLNSDDYDDIIIGAPYTSTGNVYVVYGSENLSSTINLLADSNLTINGVSVSDLTGYSVSSDWGKIIIGAPESNLQKGTVYIVHPSNAYSGGNLSVNQVPNATQIILNTTSIYNFSTDNLTCYAKATDADNSTTIAHWRWYMNGTLNISGNTTISNNTLTNLSTLLSGNTTIGDNWTCSVLASDGLSNSSWINSSNITIKNIASTIAEFHVNSTSGFNMSSDDLRCWVRAVDDTYETLTAHWRWFNGSGLELSGSTSISNNTLTNISTLMSGNISVGNTWNCSFLISNSEINTSRRNTSMTISGTPGLVNATTDKLIYSSGETVTFTAHWVDPGDTIKLLIANNSAFTACNYTDQTGCIANSSEDTTSPTTAIATASNTVWFARVCDDGNSCSERPAAVLTFGANTNLSSSNASWYGSETYVASGGLLVGMITYGNFLGYHISKAGDVNGDGYDDILVSEADWVTNARGRVYLIYGNSSKWLNNINVSNAGASFVGDNNLSEIYKMSSSDGCDVNGDGLSDIIIGAYDSYYYRGLGNANGFRGSVNIIFGIASGWAMNTSVTNNANVKLLGAVESFYRYRNIWGGRYDSEITDRMGYSVKCLGDVNDDSYDDILIGAPWAKSGGDSAGGKAYIVLGRASWPSSITNITQVATGSFIGGDRRFGQLVESAGDFNGDGYNDFLITEDYKVRLVLGESSFSFGSGSVDATWSGAIDIGRAEYVKRPVSGGCDVNNDGYDDVIIGSRGTNITGKVYVVFGSATVTGASSLSSLESTSSAASFVGEYISDQAGYSVSCLNDTNNDGYDDILISSPSNDEFGLNIGKNYLILGHSGTWPNNANLSTANSSWYGELPLTAYGYSVSSAGDMNGDGLNDIVIGAGAINHKDITWLGKTYVIFPASTPDFGSISINEGAPEVQLITPSENNSNINYRSYTTFTCSANDTEGLRNISIYTNLNNAWQLYDSINFTETKEYSFSSSIRPDDFDYWNNSIHDREFKWNCLAYDTGGSSAWGPVNYTFSGWDLGNYTNTIYNITNGSVHLSGSEWTGNYISSVKDSGEYSTWTNFTMKITNFTVNSELPNQESDGNANMTGNILLFHFNNDSTYGENDSHMYDFSGNGSNGTCTNCPAWNSSGKFNGAFEFDGSNDRIQTINNLPISGTQARTVSLWFKTINDASGAFFEIGENSVGSGVFSLYINNNNIRYWGHSADYSTDDNINQNQWYHLAITYNGSHNTIYLNGTEIDHRSHTVNTVSDVAVFGWKEWNGDYLNALIDEIAIWNRSLSAAEIQNLYSRATLGFNISTRSCDDANCFGENWQLSCSNITFCNLSTTPRNRYFQYMAEFNDLSQSNKTKLHNITINFMNSTERPYTTFISIRSTSGKNTTAEDLNCYARGTDPDDSSLVAYWRWYRNGTLNTTGSTAIIKDITTLITTITSGNTTQSDNWICSIMMSDNTNNETTWNNATIRIIESDIPILINVTVNKTYYEYGENVTFIAHWTDPGDTEKLLIMNSTDFTNCDYNTQTTCIANGSASSSSPINATVVANVSLEWHAKICDSTNKCSIASTLQYTWNGSNNITSANTTWYGERSGDYLGNELSVGDLNGDGYKDVVMVAPNKVYVVFGEDALSTPMGEINISRASNGSFVAGENFFRVASGDVNNDGYDDILIQTTSGINSNKIYLVLGHQGIWADNVNISTNANASWYGETNEFFYGRVDIVGDVNGDGYNDIIVGSPLRDINGTNTGTVYIIFGKTSGWEIDVNITEADASFYGEFSYNRLGVSGSDFSYTTSKIGDVNGDSIDDILLGTSGASAVRKSYLIFGKTSGWETNVNVSTADASFVSADANLQYYVSGVGDVNDDGFNDFVISAEKESRHYLVFGKPSGWATDANLSLISNASFITPFRSRAVVGGGDVNNDGYDDILIAEGISSNAGTSYLFLGKSSNWSMNTNMNDADTSWYANGFTNYGPKPKAMADINNDGLDDIIISSFYHSIGMGVYTFGEVNLMLSGGSSNITVGAAPNTTEMRLNSTSGFQFMNEDLTCWVKGLDAEGDNMTAHWRWYMNGTFNISGSTNIINNTLSNISTISNQNITRGDNWTCSVLVGDSFANETKWNNITITTRGSMLSMVNTTTGRRSFTVGETVEFTGHWSGDPNGTVKLLISNSTGFPNCNYTVQSGCMTNASNTTSPIYASMAFANSTKWYAKFCDGTMCTSRERSVSNTTANVTFIYKNIYLTGERQNGTHVSSDVSKAGDVNRDGYDDIVVSDAGRVYIIFGRHTDDWSSNLSVYTYNESDNSAWIALPDSYVYPSEADVVLYASEDYCGGNVWACREYCNLDPDNYQIPLAFDEYSTNCGQRTNNYLLGNSISGGGDLNGDGYDDIVIGAPHFSNFVGYYGGIAALGRWYSLIWPWKYGAVYVVYGRETEEWDSYNWDLTTCGGLYSGRDPTTWQPECPIQDLTGVGFFTSYTQFTKRLHPDKSYLGQVSNLLGDSVAMLGDFDGDGNDDIAAGAPYWSECTRRKLESDSRTPCFGLGSADIISGNGQTLYSTASYRGSDGVRGSIPSYQDSSTYPQLHDRGSSQLGQKVSKAGDVNGDGLADAIITATDKHYLMFGGSSSANVNISEISDVSFNKLYTVYMSQSNDIMGVGDVNNDSYDDILIIDDLSRRNAYLFFGKENWNATYNLTDADVNFTDLPYNSIISPVGDVNGDGIDDFSLGPKLVLGHGGYWPPIINITEEYSIRSVGTSIGDVNGDGYDDTYSQGQIFFFSYGMSAGVISEGFCNITITTDTTWSENKTCHIITVENNATLYLNSQVAGGTILLNTTNITVMGGSSINATGMGYGSGSGPGAGTNATGGSTNGAAGASHGGGGGVGSGSVFGQSPKGAIYGSSLQPTEMGSGGGNHSSTDSGGIGGGGIRIIVNDTLRVDGSIVADGDSDSSAQRGGGGSGGSIWVTTRNLLGSGYFSAKGGNQGTSISNWGVSGAGGGGRIAIYYNYSVFNFANSTVSGGINYDSSLYHGSTGTLIFIDVKNNSATIVSGFRFQNETINVTNIYNTEEDVFNFTAINITNADNVIGNVTNLTMRITNITVINSTWNNTKNNLTILNTILFTIQNNSRLFETQILNITTINLTIDSNSSINSSQSGYLPGEGPGAGADNTGAYGAPGGGHGGKGGVYGGGPNGTLYGRIYGSSLQPTTMGSGGGINLGGSKTSSGGGAIRIIASGTMILDGIIVSDAENTKLTVDRYGAGAGGSIWVTTDSIKGSGNFSAKGGNAVAGGGGGGRIAVYYNNSEIDFTRSLVSGSTTGNKNGSAGTLAFIDIDNNTLTIVNDFKFQNETVNVTNIYNTDNPGVFNFSIINITNGTAIGNASNITLVANSIYITTGGKIINSTYLTISAKNITIDENSSINSTGMGFNSNQGPGAGTNATGGGLQSAAGGGHGGVGGPGSTPTDIPGGAVYGSSLQPTTLGSGGGHSTILAIGASGGGTIRIIANDTFTLNGKIISDGGSTPNVRTGGGSGGSIWVTASNLSGSGSFRAKGGDGEQSYGGGSGAGGRIAVYYNYSDMIFEKSTVYTGSSYGTNNGSVGTLAFIDEDNNSITVVEGFRFQNETISTDFYSPNTPAEWNFTNITMYHINNVTSNITTLNINAVNINITNATWVWDITGDQELRLQYSNSFTDANTIYPDNVSLSIENTNLGKIKWIPALNATGNLSADVRFGARTVFVNSSKQPNLNNSANITTYGLWVSMPAMMFDIDDDGVYDDCNSTSSPTCINLSYSDGIFKFNTTGFSTYFVTDENMPVIEMFVFNATTANNYTTDDLVCHINVTDPNDDTVKLYYSIYNGSELQVSGTIDPVDVGVAVNITMTSGNTTKYEIWKCSIMVTDHVSNTTLLNRTITIEDTPPTRPILDEPSNYTNISDSTPFFNWTASTDIDGDTIFYGIEITDDTGFTYLNQSNYTLNIINYTALTLNDSTYYWRVKAITSDNNSSWSDVKTFKVDTVAPPGISNLLSPSQGITWIYWTWTNPTDADFSYSEIKLNGTWKGNITSVAALNITNLLVDTYYNISIRTVDNAGNINQTWINDTNKTTTGSFPTWSENTTNTTQASRVALFSVHWKDVEGLSGFIFSTNNTGTWTNDSWTEMTGTLNWSNVTKTLNSEIGVEVQWMVYVNDTNNNWIATEIFNITMSDILAIEYIDLNSTTSDNYTNETLTCYVRGKDSNNENIIIHWEWYFNDARNMTGNTTISNDTLTNITAISSINTSKNQNWTCSALVSDGELNSSWINSSVLTIRNAPPLITSPTVTNTTPLTNDVINCTNGTVVDQDGDSVIWHYRWYDTGTLITGQNSSTLNFTLTGLDKDDTITCSMIADDGTNNSTDWKNSSNSAIIQNTIPETITLDQPSNVTFTSDSTPFFNWTTSTDADGDTITYGIEISDNKTFSYVNQSNYTLDVNNYTALTLNDSTYYWRAKAITDDANSSWTTYFILTIDTVAPSITINSPQNDTINSDAFNFTYSETVNWTAYSVNGSANTTTTGVTEWTGTLSNLADGTNNITVYANDSAGNSNSTTIYWTRDTAPPAGIINLTSPSQGMTWIYWNWTNPSDSDFDHVEIELIGDDGYSMKVNTSDNEINHSYPIYPNLMPDTYYTIRIKTVDTLGNVNTTEFVDTNITSASSLPSWSFNNTNNTVAGGVTLFSMRWSDDVGLQLYNFSTNNSGTWEEIYGVMSGTIDWSNVTITLNSTSNISIQWRVTGYDSDWNQVTSDTFNLTTTTTPPYILELFTNSSQGGNITNESLTCYVNATDLENETLTAEWKWYVNNTETSETGNITINNETLTNITVLLSGNTTKGDRWICSVIVLDGEANSTWANSSYVEILDSGPSTPTLDQPSDETITSNTTPFLNWTISTDIDDDTISYAIEVYNSTFIDNSNLEYSNHSIDGNSHIPEVLPDNAYYWRVKAITTNANSSWSIMSKFTVDTTIPAITILSPTNTTYITNWTYLNITTNENVSWCGYSLNDSTNITMENNSLTNWYKNITELDDRTYNITVYCNDTVNNINRSAYVYFTIDTSPPASIINLTSPLQGTTWIYWNWTNPTDADFNYTEIQVNGTWLVNTSNNYYNLTDKLSFTYYEIQTRTWDTRGNANTTWVNDTNRTMDSSVPTWAENSTNNTIRGEIALFAVQWRDNLSLSGFIFSTNNTGTWTNDSWTEMTGILNWSNVTKTLNSTIGTIIQWRVYTNDSDNNWVSTKIFELLTNTTKPNITQMFINSSTGGNYTTDNLTCYVNMTDLDNETSIAYWSWYRNTTLFVSGNTTISNSTLTNTTTISSVNTSKRYTWNCSIMISNGYENSTQRNVSITIRDSLPSNITLDQLSNGTSTSNTTPFLNWTISIDNDTEDTITYYIEISNSTGFETVNITQYSNEVGENNYSASEINDSTYYWRIKAMTDDANSSWTDYFILIIDTIAPSITINSPQNNTIGSDAFNFTYSETVNWTAYSVNGSTNVTNTSVLNWAGTLSNLADGAHNITVYANDSAGNSNSTTIYWTRDTAPPSTVTDLTSPGSPVSPFQGTTWIYWNWTNPTDSDFNYTEIQVNGTWVANTSNNYFNTTNRLSGTYYEIQTRTWDTRGNANTTWVNDTNMTLVSLVPTWTYNSTNNTVAGGVTLFSVYWMAVDGLSFYIFSTNNTGTWVDSFYTISGTGNWSNVTKTLNANGSTEVQWYVTVVDSQGRTATTPTFSLTTTTNIPVIQQLILNSTTDRNLTSDNLTCFAEGTDNVFSNLTALYRWYRNGALNQTGENTTINVSTLSNISTLNETTSVGDTWICSVMLSSTDASSSWSNSSSLSIRAEGSPVLEQLILNSTTGNNITSDNLTCYVRGADSDNSTLIAHWRWYKNNVQNLTGNTTISNNTLTNITILLSGNTSRNQNWTCSVLVSDNKYNSSWQNLTLLIQNLRPRWSSNSASSTTAGQLSTFTVSWTDDINLSGFIFSTNNSGTWANDSWAPMTNTSNQSSATKTLTAVAGTIVQWKVYANDSNNEWNETDTFNLTTTASSSDDSPGGGTTGSPTGTTGGAALVTSGDSGEADIRVSPDSIFIETGPGREVSETITIENNGTASGTVNIYGTGDVAGAIKKQTVILAANDTKRINIKIYVSQDTPVGNYSGFIIVEMGDKKKQIIFTLVVLEELRGILDMKLTLLNDTVLTGSALPFIVDMSYFGREVPAAINLVIRIMLADVIIKEYKETVLIENDLSLSRSIEVPMYTVPGEYELNAKAFYLNNTAIAGSIINVEDGFALPWDIIFLITTLVVAVTIALIFLYKVIIAKSK